MLFLPMLDAVAEYTALLEDRMEERLFVTHGYNVESNAIEENYGRDRIALERWRSQELKEVEVRHHRRLDEAALSWMPKHIRVM